MRRIAIMVFALMMLALSCAPALADVPAKPETYAHVYDFGAEVFSEADMAAIEALGRKLEEETGIQLIAVAVNFLDGMDPADYVTDLINKWGIGQKDEDNGVVILLARGDRRVQIGTGTGLDRVLTGSKCGELIDRHIDHFANYRFTEGMVALYGDVAEFLTKAQGERQEPASATADVSIVKETEETEISEWKIKLIHLGVLIANILFVLFLLRFVYWVVKTEIEHKKKTKKDPRTYVRENLRGSNTRDGYSRGGDGYGGSSSSSGGFGGGSSRGGGGGRSF